MRLPRVPRRACAPLAWASPRPRQASHSVRQPPQLTLPRRTSDRWNPAVSGPQNRLSPGRQHPIALPSWVEGFQVLPQAHPRAANETLRLLFPSNAPRCCKIFLQYPGQASRRRADGCPEQPPPGWQSALDKSPLQRHEKTAPPVVIVRLWLCRGRRARPTARCTGAKLLAGPHPARAGRRKVAPPRSERPPPP